MLNLSRIEICDLIELDASHFRSKTSSRAQGRAANACCKRRSPLSRLGQDRQATAILEFALVTPVFLLLLFAIFGVGISNLYQLTLDEAVRNAARQVQIAGPASTGAANFVAAVCASGFGIMAPNCTTALTYNVQTNASATANFTSLVPVAMPASGNLPNVFPNTLPANNNVLVQVAFALPITFPFIGSAVTFTGTNSILSTTTIRMEPYQ